MISLSGLTQVLLIVTLLLAGCAAPAGPQGGASSPGSISWTPDCTIATHPTVEGGLCAAFFKDAALATNPETEASLATHPTDPRRVLVTWTEDTPFPSSTTARKVHAAVTRDGGLTWTRTVLQDQTLTRQPAEDSWDSSAGWSLDGTALVTFGRHTTNNPRSQVIQGVEFARSSDDGKTWRYAAVATFAPNAQRADFFDLSVAPDSGRLYISAIREPSALAPPSPIPGGSLLGPASGGLWIWASDDGGASWRDISPSAPPSSTEPEVCGPRIAAGPGGVVVVVRNLPDVGKSCPPTTGVVNVSVSHDGGASWTATTVASVPKDGANGRGPPIIRDGGRRIDLILYTGARVNRVASTDGGNTWSPPEAFAQTSVDVNQWAVPARSTTGAFATLVQSGDVCGKDAAKSPTWGVDFFTEGTAGPPVRMSLVGPLPSNATSGCTFSGNDYGGVAFSADGSLWAAWADPRAGESSGIAVAHLVVGASEKDAAVQR